MNLLLLLSALLSALGGVGARAIGPERVHAVAQESARRALPARVAVQPTSRPVAGLPALAQIAWTPVMRVAMPIAIPAWMTRRRE